MPSGTLRSSIKINIPTVKRGPGAIRRVVGARVVSRIRGTKAYYGHFIEYGFHLGGRATNATIGVAKGKKTTKEQRETKRQIDALRRFVPGVHFMQKAFDRHKANARNIAASTIRAEIAKLEKPRRRSRGA